MKGCLLEKSEVKLLPLQLKRQSIIHPEESGIYIIYILFHFLDTLSPPKRHFSLSSFSSIVPRLFKKIFIVFCSRESLESFVFRRNNLFFYFRCSSSLVAALFYIVKLRELTSRNLPNRIRNIVQTRTHLDKQ